MLNIEEISQHWQLKPASVRQRIKSGDLNAVMIAGRYRSTWENVWACECGGQPGSANIAHYKMPLLTRQNVAARLGVSARTVERWVTQGLPTRSVGGCLRFNAFEVDQWFQREFGIDARDTTLPGTRESAR